MEFCTDDKPLGLVHRDRSEQYFALTQQWIGYLVNHRPRAIARNDTCGIMQPFLTEGCLNPEAKIPATARKIKGEFGHVTGIDAKRRIPAIKRAIEKLLAVLNNEIGLVRTVTKRTVGFADEISLPFDNGATRAEYYRDNQKEMFCKTTPHFK
jgi:hypothetical protein